MAGEQRTVYIAGAGIGGLTLALALAKFGASVVVLERNRTISEVGAGLQIGPNARKVLNHLGLDRAMAARSFEPAGIDVYPYRARRPLVRLEAAAAMRETFGAPYAVMHRGDLVDMLAQACRRFANIDIVFGARSFDVAEHARGISVNAVEADGRIRSARAFAFVGADGVRSPTRTAMLGGPAADYRSRYVAWRILLEYGALDGLIAPDAVSVFMGPGYHAVCYPLPYRRRLNVVLFSKEKANLFAASDPPRRPRLPWAMLPSRHFEAILGAAGDDWGFWPLGTVETPAWSDGAVGLIGDAAHAMTPFQAQGAAMAIEDAAILAPLLMAAPDAATAFGQYEKLRRPRVRRVARQSASNGSIFHMEWPFTLARDATIALQGSRGHLRRLSWLYGYDAVTPAP